MLCSLKSLQFIGFAGLFYLTYRILRMRVKVFYEPLDDFNGLYESG